MGAGPEDQRPEDQRPGDRAASGLTAMAKSPIGLALAASVLVNVFLLAAWAGRATQTPAPAAPQPFVSAPAPGDAARPVDAQPRAAQGARRRGFIARLMRDASPELRALAERVQAERTPDFQAQRAKLRALRDQRRAVLRAQPFDEAAWRALQADAQREHVKLRAMAYDAFTEMVAQASDAQRAELASLLERFAARRAARRAAREAERARQPVPPPAPE